MKLLLPLMIIALVAFQRCNDDIVHIPKDQFILKVNETYDAGDFQLQLTDISDSRCPKDVECIWMGAVITTLALKAPSRQDTLQFCLGNCMQLDLPVQETHSDTLLVNKVRYELTLLEVSPYPGTGREKQEATARYSLKEL